MPGGIPRTCTYRRYCVDVGSCRFLTKSQQVEDLRIELLHENAGVARQSLCSRIRAGQTGNGQRTAPCTAFMILILVGNILALLILCFTVDLNPLELGGLALAVSIAVKNPRFGARQ